MMLDDGLCYVLISGPVYCPEISLFMEWKLSFHRHQCT